MEALATVLVISFSDLASDPRVDRQIEALLTKHRVIAAGLAPSRHDRVDFIDIRTPASLGVLHGGMGIARLLAHRFEAAYWKQPKYRAPYQRLLGVPADVVIANDIAALPIAALLGPPVVFDAHEYAPEQFNDRWWWRQLIAPYVRWHCRRYLPGVAAMTTVGQGIADVYEREFGVRGSIVINAPPYEDLNPTPVHDPVRILHHGAAQRGRGLEEMVRVACLLDDRFTVDFVLSGPQRVRDAIIGRARHNPRIRFPPPVPARELVRMANRYDIGLYLLPPNNLNRRYALPNKLFEFIQGRLAVAIGPSPEMAAIVRRYSSGVVSDDFSPEALAAAINSLDPAAIEGFKRASHRAATELCAERNIEPVLSTVDVATATVSMGRRLEQ